MYKIFEKWFNNNNNVISLINYKKSWSVNGVGRQFCMFTNKATINDKCFSFTFQINYFNFNITLYDMGNNNVIKFLRKIKERKCA